MGMARSWVGDGQSPEEICRLVYGAAVQHRRIARFTTANQGSCVSTCWVTTSRASGDGSVIGAEEKPRANHYRMGVRESAVSIAEGNSVVGRSLAKRSPRSQRCVANIAVDAETIDGDPQNGQ